MNRTEAKLLVRSWCEFQLDPPSTRDPGPNGWEAPEGSSLPPPHTNFYEYQFVQRQIEIHCEKPWDRAMLVAILQETSYRGHFLLSPVMGADCQSEATARFLERFSTLVFVRSQQKVEIG